METDLGANGSSFTGHRLVKSLAAGFHRSSVLPLRDIFRDTELQAMGIVMANTLLEMNFIKNENPRIRQLRFKIQDLDERFKWCLNNLK